MMLQFRCETALFSVNDTAFSAPRYSIQGADVSDFRFVRHETDAGDGWERTKSV